MYIEAEWHGTFVSSAQHTLIVDVMKECDASPAVLLEGLGVLAVLAVEGKFRRTGCAFDSCEKRLGRVFLSIPEQAVLIRDNVHLAVVETLRRQQDHEDVTKYCLRVLHRLVSSTSGM